MSGDFAELSIGKVMSTGDYHLELIAQVDTDEPTSYVNVWDVSKGAGDSVRAYLTGSGSNLSLHIYGMGEMKNFAQLSLSQSPYYTAPWADCSDNIKNIRIHNGVTSVGQYTFFGYRGYGNPYRRLSSLIIADSVRVINRYAFHYTPISDVVIPTGVRRICESAFALAYSEPCTVTIPQTVRVVDYSAFLHTQFFDDAQAGFLTVGDGCVIQYTGQATSLSLPQGTKCVSLFNWSNKTGCSSVTLPDSVKYLATGAFSGFTSLQSIKLPQGCRHISFNAFSSDSNLTAVYVPQSVTQISSRCIITSTGIESCLPALSPFYGANGNLRIYCGAASKPAGFDDYWDYTGASSRATVYWGVSEQEYDEIQSGGNV